MKAQAKIVGNVVATVVASDPGIICYQHCGPKIFAFELPQKCYACGCDLVSINKNEIPPFRLPYPFIKASQYPCAVILRPTTGDFLK